MVLVRMAQYMPPPLALITISLPCVPHIPSPERAQSTDVPSVTIHSSDKAGKIQSD